MPENGQKPAFLPKKSAFKAGLSLPKQSIAYFKHANVLITYQKVMNDTTLRFSCHPRPFAYTYRSWPETVGTRRLF
jgi:hypothetical protein